MTQLRKWKRLVRTVIENEDWERLDFEMARAKKALKRKEFKELQRYSEQKFVEKMREVERRIERQAVPRRRLL